MKAELRSASTMCGVLCVRTHGESLMLLWYAGSWATPHKVSIGICLQATFSEALYLIYQQMQLPLTTLTLGLVLALSTWTMWTAVAMSVTSLIVHVALLSTVTLDVALGGVHTTLGMEVLQ